MEIIKPPKPPEQKPVDVETLPKTLPAPPVTRQPAPQPVAQPQPVMKPFAGGGNVGTGETPIYDDGIQMRDPNTGQVMTSEIEEAGLQMEYLGGDPLRAVYQGLVWAAESFKRLAMTTPALAGLSPATEGLIDQIATIGYQVTNAGAELSRGLWNWPFTRVIINQSMEQVIHPEEWGTFNKLYREWHENIIAPVESGQAKYDPEKIKSWIGSHSSEIADPGGFIRLCSQRYAMERVAAKSAWTPTDVLATSKPVGMRQTTTTGLESVFKKKPG